MVGVLILVDEHVTKASAVVLGYVREQLQQRHRRPNQVIEVKGSASGQPPLVLRVRFRDRLLHGIARTCCVRLVVNQLVLRRGHVVQERTRGVSLGVEVEVPDHHLHQPQRVGLVVDAERRRHTEAPSLLAENPNARAVKRRYRHRPRCRSHELHHTLPHFRCRLVGEGDGHDLPRRRIIRGEQMRNAPSEYPGLAGPRAGDDQQRPTSMFNRSLLRRIEVMDQRLGVHYRPILSGPCDSTIVQPTVEPRRAPGR